MIRMPIGDESDTCVVTCSSLEYFVRAAQKKGGTHFQVHVVDRNLHAEPERMKRTVGDVIRALPARFRTVLVGMGFCGGAWDHAVFERRIVVPRADDCISILLHKGDETEPNLKEPGHLYLYEPDPEQFSALRLLRDPGTLGPEYEGMDRDTLFRYWFGNYHWMDIIDTGLTDCYDERYVELAQENADRIGAGLGYAEGSNRMLEKLVSGRWDGQFVVAEPGQMIRHADFFG